MTDGLIVSVGGAGIDFLVRSASLPSAGQCVTASSFHDGVGGKGANQAVAAARFGARSALVAAVGHDERGARVLAQLERERVQAERVVRIAGAETAAVIIESDATGRKQVAVLRGANAHLTAEHVDEAAELIRDAAVVMVQFEIGAEAASRAIEIAAAAKSRVVLDASPAGRVDDRLLPLVYGVKANAHEATALTGVKVRDGVTAREAAKRISARGVRLVAVEAGEDGNLFMLDGAEFLQRRYIVPSVDATGAGDAMTAALAVALIERMPVADLARFVSAAAALTTTKTGAQDGVPTRRVLDQFLATAAR